VKAREDRIRHLGGLTLEMYRRSSFRDQLLIEQCREIVALEDRLRDPAYPGKLERAILFTVEAWDVNCQQHIHERYSRRQIAPVVEKLQARIAELEVAIQCLKASPVTT
jgi:hypothetical protein